MSRLDNPLPKKEIDSLISFAADLAYESGELLRRGFSRPRKITKKGPVDLVTSVDFASERLIVRKIKKCFTTHDIVAEEQTCLETGSDFRWYIDPLDGTINFAHGYPQFCVSLALHYKERALLGVIYEPLRDELFSAGAGRGARMNTRKIHVSVPSRLIDSLCATGFPYDTHISRKNNLANFNRVIKQVRDIRRGGSAALDLCYLACGRLDAFWEIKLSRWDTAAGALIASEAGARVTDFAGRPFQPQMKEIMAANANLHKKMLPLLR